MRQRSQHLGMEGLVGRQIGAFDSQQVFDRTGDVVNLRGFCFFLFGCEPNQTYGYNLYNCAIVLVPVNDIMITK